jgi:hypothetical protein
MHDASRVAHKNVQVAIRAAIEILKLGHSPFCPHLSHYIHLETETPFTPEVYYKLDLDFLAECNALLFLGSSPGADAELEEARRRRLQIFYSIDEIPQAEPPMWDCEDLKQRVEPLYAGLDDAAKQLCLERMMKGHEKFGMRTMLKPIEDTIMDMITEAGDLLNYSFLIELAMKLQNVTDEKAHKVMLAADNAARIFFAEIEGVL